MLTWWWYCHGMGFYGSLISCLILSLYPVCCVMSLVGMFHCLFTCCSRPVFLGSPPVWLLPYSCLTSVLLALPYSQCSLCSCQRSLRFNWYLILFFYFSFFLDLPLSVFVLRVYGLTLSVLIRIFFCLNLTGVTTVWMPIPNTLERRASFFVNWIIWVNIQSIS